MTYEELCNLLPKLGGGKFHTLKFKRTLQTLKGVEDKVEKVTVMTVKIGVPYDNNEVVKQGRQAGTLPCENQGLPRGTEWVKGKENQLIRSINTGKIQLRATRIKNHSNTIYLKNGQPVHKDEVRNLCRANEFHETKPGQVVQPSPIFNIGIEKIEYIH